jgi:hypothetical protein
VRIVSMVLASALLGLGHATLVAQEGLGLSLETGMVTFAGHAHSVGITPETGGHPSSGRTWGLQLDRTGRNVRFSVGVMIASTGVELENDDAAAEAKNVLGLLSIAPEISLLVFRPRQASIRFHGGLVFDRWSPEGDDARTSLGGLGAVSVEVPLSARIGMRLRWEGALTGSVFDEDDLPTDFERKTGIRQRWVVGARYGLQGQRPR